MFNPKMYGSGVVKARLHDPQMIKNNSMYNASQKKSMGNITKTKRYKKDENGDEIHKCCSESGKWNIKEKEPYIMVGSIHKHEIRFYS